MNLFNILGCSINVDPIIPASTTLFVNILKIAIPIILVIFGMLDLGKAVMSNDEKEMKTAQSKFIKRILYAVIIFFIVAVVQLVFNLLGKASTDSGTTNTVNQNNISACINCFINGKNCYNEKTVTDPQ